jgi:hypothetical protein
MSTVQPTDKVLVQRAATLHSAPADMSTVQDTDLLLINRAGVDYKCTVADWKASQSKPPAIASVTLADSPEAGRFTSGTFLSTVVMTDEGIPASTKGIKAYVQGTLKTQVKSSAITAVASIPAPTTWSMSALLTGSGAETFTPVAYNDPSLHKVHTGLAVGSNNTDASNCHVIVMWTDQPTGDVTFKCRVGAGDARKIQFYISNDGITWKKDLLTTLNDIAVGGSHNTIHFPARYIQFNIGTGYGQFYNLTGAAAGATLTLTDSTNLSSFASGDAVTEVTAAGAAGDATGTVGAVDATTKTITLSATAGTWDVGSAVKGPLKTSSSVKLFCKLNAGLTVTDLQSADPGYTAVTGAGPYTVTFPATLPTGAAPDVDLPAGTSLTTEVQAVNSSATVTKTSNTVVPA